jgi:hypothetical protein
MALLVPLEDYRNIARQCKGTPACGAILGLISETECRGTLLAHARDGGEVQDCEVCGQWFRLEETHSLEEGGWICKGCASPGGSDSTTGGN